MGGFSTLRYDRGFGADQLLTLPEAARLADVAFEELRAHIESGPMNGQLVTEADCLIPAVTRAELAAHFPAAYPAPGLTAPASAAAPASAELQAEVEQLRIENAQLGAELAMATRVERSLQAYADRLEARLAAAPRQRPLTPARAVPETRAVPEARERAAEKQAQVRSERRPGAPATTWRQRLLRLLGRRAPTARLA